MRVMVLCVVAACDLQPAPHHQQAAAAMAAPSATCGDVAAHYAAIVISSESDASQRAVFEQDRANIVRSTSAECAAQQWPAVKIDCFVQASTKRELDACSTKFPSPPVRRPG